MSVQTLLFDQDDRRRSKATAKIEEVVGDGFDVHQFLENFHVLVEVAGSTKLLKELILELAMRGRLSAPHGHDADSLVDELEQRRAEVGGKGVRVSAEGSPVSEDEKPYDIPGGWRWVRLRDLGGFAGGGTPAKSNASFWKGPIPWVSPKDMKRPYIDDAEDHISMAAVEGSAVKLIPSHSILYVVRGMILAHSFPVAVTTREVTINQDMKALVLAMPKLREFVLRSLQAARRRVLGLVERSSHGTCRLDSEAVENLPLALPPLAEQKRIVAKVDQLMALSDELEARQTKKRETGTRLTKSALEALTTAEGPEEFDAGWKRVVENWSDLFGRSETVQALRGLVREVAIRGVLVPSTHRKSAHDALKGRRGRETGILAESAAAERLGQSAFRLPDGWCWARMEALAEDASNAICAGPFGTIFKARDFRPAGVPIIFLRHVAEGRYLTRKPGYMDTAKWEELFKPYSVWGGELLVTKLGDPPGVCAIYPEQIGHAMVTPDVIKMSVDRRVADPSYLMTFLNSDTARRLAFRAAYGLTRSRMNIPIFRDIPVPLPPLEVQKHIAAAVERYLAICDDLERHLQRSEECAAKLAAAAVQEVVA